MFWDYYQPCYGGPKFAKKSFRVKGDRMEFWQDSGGRKGEYGAPRQSNKPKKRGSDIGAAGRIHILKF